MKKILHFICNTKKGQKIMLGCTVGITLSLVIGLILSLPFLWLGHREYGQTWMNSVAAYFFYPFICYCVLFIFLFVPYASHVVSSGKYEGDSKRFIKGMTIFCSLVPGAIIYSLLAKVLLIPSGMHNLAGILIFGLLYLWIMKIILRKPFRIAQTFVPLS